MAQQLSAAAYALAQAALRTLRDLEDMTTDAFSRGADREARLQLLNALHQAAQAGIIDSTEYADMEEGETLLSSQAQPTRARCGAINPADVDSARDDDYEDASGSRRRR